MKITHLAWLAVGTAVLALNLALHVAPPGLAEEEDGPQDPMQEMMELERKLATPGPQHAFLAWYVGTWNVETRLTMPGMPATEPDQGTCEISWLFEGRWLQQRFQSSFMGKPIHHFGMLGFDNLRQKHVMTWVDDVSTRMVRAEGVVCDPTGRTLVYYGEMDEPSMGVQDKAFKLVRRRVDEDTFAQEVWDLGIGPEGAKVFEMTFARVK